MQTLQLRMLVLVKAPTTGWSASFRLSPPSGLSVSRLRTSLGGVRFFTEASLSLLAGIVPRLN